ncbi:MAG: stage III sporulation protein AE [Lachnospira sp.]
MKGQKHISKKCIYMCLISVFVFIISALSAPVNCSGAEVKDYDFSDVDRSIKENEAQDYIGSFKELVLKLVNGENSGDKGVFRDVADIFINSFTAHKDVVINIIILAVLSAFISSFAPVLNKGMINDTAHMIIEIMLITLLMASFYSAVITSTDTIQGFIDIYKSLIPAFFSAVTFASGSITSAAYYEVVLIAIAFVNDILKNVILRMVKVYLLLGFADLLMKKSPFSQAMELILTVIKWGCKLSLVAFSGVAGLKGMINPISDEAKKSVIYKTLKIIPGIGNGVDTVSSTVAGAGAVIKNAVGVAAIIVIMAVCCMPVMKLVSLTVIFKVTAAAIEPVADKRIVKAVGNVSTAIGLLCIITLTAMSLFLLMTAIICICTNYGVK